MTALVIAGKELLELVRDVRSLILSVGTPLVLFPALFVVLDAGVRSHEPTPTPITEVGILAGVELSPVWKARLSGVRLRRDVDHEDVLSGGIPAAVAHDGVVLFNERSERSHAAAMHLRALLSAPGDEGTVRLVGAHGVAAGGRAPSGVGVVPGTHVATATAFPLLLFLAALVSLLPAALDLGAGEKQRGTLEPLLVTAGSPGAVFVGKLVAVTVGGVLGVVSFIAGVAIASRIAPDLFTGAISLSVVARGDVGSVLAVSAALVVFLAVVELTISLVARSPREAQSYFLPLLLIVSAAAYVAVFSDAWHVPAWYGWVPLLNIGVALKGLILEAPAVVAPGVVVGQTVFWSALIALGGRAVLRSEWVLKRS